MLSRTADNLYWLARYMERADFLARVIQASRRLASLPKAYGGAESEWESVLLSAGSATAFAQTNPHSWPPSSATRTTPLSSSTNLLYCSGVQWAALGASRSMTRIAGTSFNAADRMVISTEDLSRQRKNSSS